MKHSKEIIFSALTYFYLEYLVPVYDKANTIYFYKVYL